MLPRLPISVELLAELNTHSKFVVRLIVARATLPKCNVMCARPVEECFERRMYGRTIVAGAITLLELVDDKQTYSQDQLYGAITKVLDDVPCVLPTSRIPHYKEIQKHLTVMLAGVSGLPLPEDDEAPPLVDLPDE